MRIDFTANTPGPQNIGLGDVQEGNLVDGKWKETRQIEGDDDAQGEILVLRPNSVLRREALPLPINYRVAQV